MKRRLSQMGYVTPDLEASLDYWIDIAGAGPFYYAEYEPERQLHRGKPTHIRFRLAYGYLGDIHIEVVQQLSGGASAYTEALANSDGQIPRGGVLHHMLMFHDGYDAIHDRYVAAGAEPCYSAFVEGVGRFCYLDTRALMGCYLELVEDTAVFEAACEKMRAAHQQWDGRRPRRDFDEIFALL